MQKQNTKCNKLIKYIIRYQIERKYRNIELGRTLITINSMFAFS